MGLYIKGVTMPTNCEYCPFRAEGEDVADFCCVHSLKFIWCKFDKRPDDCPLIEVKSPHGRLIDADALDYEKIEKDAYNLVLLIKQDEPYREKTEAARADGRLGGVLALTSELRFTPTVIEAEGKDDD